MPDFALEDAIGGRVAGVDEAGRGPLAGPVVAAAVVIDRTRADRALLALLDDSKKLSPARRRAIYPLLWRVAAIGVGAASAGEIDRINILQATLLAMTRAVARLGAASGSAPDAVLVDGNRAPRLACPVSTVIGGDGKSLSIAAASIVAKVVRDRIMARLAPRYPAFGFETNAGYPTALHLDALGRRGGSPHHRQSFAPVRAARAQGEPPTSCG